MDLGNDHQWLTPLEEYPTPMKQYVRFEYQI